jgi:putative tricarboxylic transport membrane protein
VAGTYVYRSNPMDLYFMIAFGIFGYLARKMAFDVTPLVMGFILLPPLEYAVGQTMLLARGDLFGYLFGTRPITVGVLVVMPILIFWIASRQRRQTKQTRQAIGAGAPGAGGREGPAKGADAP